MTASALINVDLESYFKNIVAFSGITYSKQASYVVRLIYLFYLSVNIDVAT